MPPNGVRGARDASILGIGVKRGLARAHSTRAAPPQEIVERDRLETCVGAAQRQAHETAIAAIQPVVIVAIVRQFGNAGPRALKIDGGYNPNENIVHEAATSVLGSHRRRGVPSFMHYQ